MDLKDKRILIVAPHPDDEALDSGGLIMRAKKERAFVLVLFMSTGGSRQFVNGFTTGLDRINEAKEASKYGGFIYRIGFVDTSTKVDTMPQKSLIEFIEDYVKDYVPDIVVIPSRDSYSQDHRAVATAAISALRPIPSAIHHQAKMILEVEEPTSWPNASNPNLYIDISEVMEEKLELYKKHKTQVVEDPYNRSCENLKRLAGLRGSEIGVKYAEAYTLLKGQL